MPRARRWLPWEDIAAIKAYVQASEDVGGVPKGAAQKAEAFQRKVKERFDVICDKEWNDREKNELDVWTEAGKAVKDRPERSGSNIYRRFRDSIRKDCVKWHSIYLKYAPGGSLHASGTNDSDWTASANKAFEELTGKGFEYPHCMPTMLKKSNTQLIAHKDAGSKAKTSKQVDAKSKRQREQRPAGVKAAIAREERAVANKRLTEMKDLVQSIVTRTTKSEKREKARFALEKLRARESSIKLRMEALIAEAKSPFATEEDLPKQRAEYGKLKEDLADISEQIESFDEKKYESEEEEEAVEEECAEAVEKSESGEAEDGASLHEEHRTHDSPESDSEKSQNMGIANRAEESHASDEDDEEKESGEDEESEEDESADGNGSSSAHKSEDALKAECGNKPSSSSESSDGEFDLSAEVDKLNEARKEECEDLSTPPKPPTKKKKSGAGRNKKPQRARESKSVATIKKKSKRTGKEKENVSEKENGQTNKSKPAKKRTTKRKKTRQVV